MWPWGHLAAGYLVYTAYQRLRYDRLPTALPVVALAVGTQFPDLVDKPLAWTVQLLPNGRSFAHSLVTTLPFLVTAGYLCRDRGDTLVFAFVLGHVTHLATDALLPLLRGNVAEVGFLAWPIVPAIDYPTAKSFLAHLTTMELTPWFGFQLGLVFVIAVVWYHDGRPGSRIFLSALSAIRDLLRSV